MRKPIYVRELNQKEQEALVAGLRSTEAFTVRRCQILLSSAAGKGAGEIGEALHCDDQTVRNAIHAFHAKGLAAISPGSSRPHTIQVAFDQDQIESLKEILHQSPREYGKVTSVWTLDLVAEVAYQQRIGQRQVSGETIRQTLKRQGIGWRRAKKWITSPDPAYERKKSNGID
jgi:transposase